MATTQYGTGGNDILYAEHDDRENVVDGLGGNDLIWGGAPANDYLIGNSGNDTLIGDYRYEPTKGGGDDYLDGGIGNDRLFGEAGNDTLVGGGGTDYFDGGAGDDTIYTDGSEAEGQDSLYGSAGNDRYVVEDFNIVFRPDGDDEGFDTLEISTSFRLVHANGSDVVAIEAITLGGVGTFFAEGNSLENVLRGNASANTLVGRGGSDELFGNSGDDYLNGGIGWVDTLRGGRGNDVYVIGDFDNIAEGFDQGTDTVDSSIRWRLGENFENLTLTGGASVNGFGNSLPNRLTGNSGANYLDAELGYDVLAGGAGDDAYALGDITFINDQSGSRYDQVIEAAGAGIDTIYVSQQGNGSAFLPANVENGTVTGTAGLNLQGNGLDNSLIGNQGVNQLAGFGGNDSLAGGLNADTLYGGAGDDIFYLDDVTAPSQVSAPRYDAVIEYADEGFDTVVVGNQGPNAENYRLTPFVENGFVTGTARFGLTGNGLGNSLVGNDASNTLTGLDGDDVLRGHLGADALRGGSGFDTASYITEFYLQGVVADLLSPGGNTAEAAGDTYSSIEGLLGSFYNDTLRGNNLDNILSGGSNGADSLFGRDGNDTLDGGAGGDNLDGGLGDDTLRGGGGQDLVRGGAGADLLFGGTNADSFLFGIGAGGITAATADRIGDWASDFDEIDTTFAGTSANYLEDDTTATTIAAAAAAAESRGSTATSYVFLFNGGSDTGYLLADLDNDDEFETGILLSGAGSASNFGFFDIV